MAVISSPLGRIRRNLKRMAIIVATLFSVQYLAFAESRFDLSTHYYDLAPGLMVIKPSIFYENIMSLATTVNARFTVDRVQAGSDDDIDALSSASQLAGSVGQHTDIRQEYVAGVSHTIDHWKLDAGYVMSLEDDYRSHAPSINLSRDFNQRNTTLTLGYAHNFDWVKGRYMEEAEQKDVENASISLSQVLSPTSLMQLSYTLQYNYGYLATGNRQVQLENELLYDEYLPGTRLRQAISLRAAKWLGSNTALHASYRYYFDDWGIASNTLEFRVYQSLGSDISLRGEYRFYRQSGADFLRDSYDGSEQYLTSASSLRSFSAHLGGLKLSYHPKIFKDFQLHMKYERYHQVGGLKGNVLMLGTDFVF